MLRRTVRSGTMQHDGGTAGGGPDGVWNSPIDELALALRRFELCRI
jgi:hypothetical protein